MKKYILSMITLLLLLLAACGRTEPSVSPETIDVQQTESRETVTEPQKPVEKSTPKEVQMILNRDIFLWKEDAPELYMATVRDMDQCIAYVDNWNLGKILNEETFENIEWTVNARENDSRIVAFSGEHYGRIYYVQFFVNERAEPLALSLYVKEKNENSESEEISVERLEEQGMDFEAALIEADILISVVLTVLSDDAIVHASEHYEAEADRYMKSGNYDRAIEYYEKANTTGDKVSAAYYAKAESCLASGDLDSAGMYFNYAGTYKDSQIRVREVFYQSGAQYEKGRDYISAISSYAMAGDYSDAREKYKECNYKQGEIDMTNRQYPEAAGHFAEAADYHGAAEKYQESCYLYADQQLLVGHVGVATDYFSKAGNYKDASTRIVEYHYEKGTEYLLYEEYLTAAEHFTLAETYSDAETMVSECYYCYGKQQLEQNYISEATEYLSKCRGYKDTDDILLSHYYREATIAVENYFHAFAEGDTYSINVYYDKARAGLALCENYGDSNNLLAAVEKLYEAKSVFFGNVSTYVQSRLKGSSISVNGNILTWEVPFWITDCGVDCSMLLIYDMDANTFNATLQNMYFNQSIVSQDKAEMMAAFLLLFTDLEQTEDFVSMYSDTNQWDATWYKDGMGYVYPGRMRAGSTAQFSISYGGYEIHVVVKSENSRLAWTISAKR